MRGRAEAEIAAMFQLWGLAIVAALLLKPRRAWTGLFAASAISLTALALADLFLTDTGLLASVRLADWPMAAIELAFLCLAAGFVWLARHSWRQPPVPVRKARRAIAPLQALAAE